MSEKIEVGAQASGEDGINNLVSAVDRLEASLAKLGAGNTALEKMSRQMAAMTKVMKSGFEQMIELQSNMDARAERQAEVAGARRLAQEEEKAARLVRAAAAAAEKKLQQQVDFEQRQEGAGNKFHFKQIEAADTAYVKQLESYEKFWVKIIAAQVAAESTQKAIQERRDIEMYTESQRAREAYVTTWEKMLAERQAIVERRDVEMHTARQREYLDYVSLWDKLLAEQATKQARQLEMERMQQYELAGIRAKAAADQLAASERIAAAAASAAERQRSLNTSFLTSPLSGQIATAEKAAVYGSLGGNSAEKFGSAAAAADIAALRAQHAALPAAVAGSTSAINGHNAAMGEAHALARGLAGSLGGLWLTYGSLVPLAAGAALAASMKAVVTAGKDVEYQLKFVQALGGGAVNLDQMLKITDQTVVSVKEAAEGMRALAQNGLNAADSLAVLPSVLNLAIIGEMTVAQAALSATGTISAFGLELSDLDRVANIFAKAAATSNTSVIAMTESMKQASTVAGIYGATVEETAAGLGVLAKVNIIGSAAGTAYTNMLTNLYTPTEKAKKALAELKITTDDGNGGLKNSTQLLSELRNALAGFNDSSKATFLGDIFTVRGQKGVSTILSNWDEYIKKTNEAKNVTDFMGEAVATLEDSTEGALKRLANNASSSFNKAFKEASPTIQALTTDLAHLAASQGVVDTLVGIADALLRVTKLVAEHSSAIGLMLTAYIGLRALSALPAMFTAVSLAVDTLSISMRGLTAAMGWIGAAVAAATLAYTLFVESTSEVEKADQRRQNSINVNIEYLDREIERLTERNKLWNPQTLQFDKEKPAPDATMGKTTQAALDAQKAQLANVSATLASRKSGDFDIVTLQNQKDKLLKDVQASENALWALTAKQEEMDVQRSINQTNRGRESTSNAINNFIRQGEAYDKLSANYAGKENAAYLAKTQQAKAILDLLSANKISNPEAVSQLSTLKAEASALLGSRAPKIDKAAANDALKADLEALQLKKDLAKMDEQMALNSLTQQNKRGEIGDLQMINYQLAAKLALDEKAVAVARQQYDAVAASDKVNKAAAEQKYKGVEQKSAKQALMDTAAANEARLTLQDKMDQEDLKDLSTVLTQKGQLVQAFLVDYEVKYRNLINKTTNDMLNSDDASFKAAAQRRLDAYRSVQDTGVTDARFKQEKTGFDAAMAAVQERISAAKAVAAEDGGISGALGLAQAADDIRSGMLPALQQMVNQLALVAKESGSDALVTAATKAQSSLNTLTKDLTKAANPFGDAWDNAWKSIERAGHTAWMNMGKGGTNMAKEVGAALKTSVLEMLYQLTVKRWMVSIGANLASAYGLDGGAGAAGAVGGAYGTASSALGAAGSAGNLLSYGSAVAGGANIFGSLASGSGAVGQFLSGASGSAAAAAEALGAEMTATAAAGAQLGAAFAAALPWVAAAGLAYAAWEAFMEDGPEDHTRIGFTSNNTPGNISINERGNEGKNSAYIGTASTSSSLGTFGVSSSFWAQDQSVTVKNFLATVSKTDDALAMFMTTAEKAAVSDYLTGKVTTAHTGAEGEDPNKNGELDGVFSARIHNIMEGLGEGLSALTDNFVGTSQELATEAAAVLNFRQALVNGGEAVFGMKVALQDLVALKQPTEATSVALTRITNTFTTTNQIAAIMGKSVEQMFGSIGLSSFKARDNLVQAAGGLDNLTKKVTSYSANFLTKAEQATKATEDVAKTMAGLGLSSVKTKAEFAAVVRGLDLVNNAADVQLFNSLMDVQQAFSDISTAAETAATALQDQVDQLTLTKVELLDKERSALDPVNRALFDNLQIQKKIADARADVATAYDNEVTAITAANDRLKTFSASLRTFRDGLVLGALSPLTPEQKYGAARSQFETTLAKAQGGDTKAQDALEGAASAFLEASRVSNASGAAYTSDFARVTAAMDDMATWADKQVDVGTASLDQLKLQVGALAGIQAAVLSLPQALAALLNAQNIKPDQAQRDSLTGLYRELLGRAPDDSGFAYWMKRMTDGASVANVADEMRRSPEYASTHSGAAFDYTAAAAFNSDAVVAELQAVKAQLVTSQDAATKAAGDLFIAMFASGNENAKIIADAIAESAREAAAAELNKVVIE